LGIHEGRKILECLNFVIARLIFASKFGVTRWAKKSRLTNPHTLSKRILLSPLKKQLVTFKVLKHGKH